MSNQCKFIQKINENIQDDSYEYFDLINCRYCKKYSTSEPGKMIKHYIMCHDGKLMKCSKCKFTCYHNKDFIMHNLDKHFN